MSGWDYKSENFTMIFRTSFVCMFWLDPSKRTKKINEYEKYSAPKVLTFTNHPNYPSFTSNLPFAILYPWKILLWLFSQVTFWFLMPDDNKNYVTILLDTQLIETDSDLTDK